MNKPKAFISYSWTTVEHELWVKQLAENLVENGVEIIFDKWDLLPGQDMHEFMERISTDSTITHVIVVSDRKYSEKANKRDGGVGEEARFITQELFDKSNEKHFIPLVREKDENGNACVPAFLKSRIHFDFEDLRNYDARLEELIRFLYDKPFHQRPKLGKPPEYLFRDKEITKTSRISKDLNSLSSEKRELFVIKINQLIYEYESVIGEFKKPGGNYGSTEYVDNFINTIRDWHNYRDEIINVFEIVASYYPNDYASYAIKLLEATMKFHEYRGMDSFTDYDMDIWKYISYDITLNLFGLAIKYEIYEQARDIVDGPYFFNSKYESKLSAFDISYFSSYLGSLNGLKSPNGGQYHSPLGELFCRTGSKKIELDYLIKCDAILFYLTTIIVSKKDKNEAVSRRDYWFPFCNYYIKNSLNFEVISKMISKRHWERAKALFNVNSVEDLKNDINSQEAWIKETSQRFGLDWHLHRISAILEIDKIASLR